MNIPSYSGNIILTGMPGSGKTNIGEKLAKELGVNFCDFDDDILEKITLDTAKKAIQVLNTKEDHTNKTYYKPEDLIRKEVKNLIEILGKNDFLKLECFMGKNLIFDSQTVLSTSGSLPMSIKAMEHLKQSGKVIYIDTPIELIVSRLGEMKKDRIIGIEEMTLEEILQYRANFYQYTKDFNFKVPLFEAKVGKTQEERDTEKEIVFERFMEFYRTNIGN